MLTYEQIQPTLHKWARHYSNNRFDYWELINQVWAMGNVQQLEHIKFASDRIKYDIIDYIRSETGCRRCKKNQVNEIPLSQLISDEMQEDRLSCLQQKPKTPEFETLDLFNALLKDLPYISKIVIILRYVYGFQQLRIAEIIHRNPSRACQIEADALKAIKAKATEQYGILHKCQKEPNNQQYRARYHYNQQYYQSNKAQIKLQKRMKRISDQNRINYKPP